MQSRLARNTFLIGLAIVLTSCAYLAPQPVFDLSATRKPVSCDRILENALVTFPYGQTTLAATSQWIRQTFDVQPREDLAISGIHFLRWNSKGRDYTVDFPSGRAVGITTRQSVNPPIAEEVLKCFGEPSFVNAYHDLTPDGPTYTVFQLWYTEMGVEFESSVPAQLYSIDHRMPMSGVNYSTPGTIDEMILARYEIEAGSDQFRRILNSIEPWPGSLDKIEIGVPPY